MGNLNNSGSRVGKKKNPHGKISSLEAQLRRVGEEEA